MDYFILALFAHGYKVRPTTLFQLLKGRRTVSVLIYGYLYDSLPYLGLFPEFAEAAFQQILHELTLENCLQTFPDGEVQITTAGTRLAQDTLTALQKYPLDNYRFGRIDREAWRLLLFSVQVVSELAYGNGQYLPLETTPLYTIPLKKWLYRSRQQPNFIADYHQEWQFLLSKLSDQAAEQIVRQFSGHELLGETIQQIGEQGSGLLEKSLQHQLFALIETHHDTCPELWQLLEPKLERSPNQSMLKTKRFLEQGLTLSEIVERRAVKVSTVQDHLLELAMTQADFPFQTLLEPSTSAYLTGLAPDYRTWRYRELRGAFDELDYFTFRLYQLQRKRRDDYEA